MWIEFDYSGNKKEEVDVPTPTLPQATDESKVYRRPKRTQQKKHSIVCSTNIQIELFFRKEKFP